MAGFIQDRQQLRATFFSRSLFVSGQVCIFCLLSVRHADLHPNFCFTCVLPSLYFFFLFFSSFALKVTRLIDRDHFNRVARFDEGHSLVYFADGDCVFVLSFDLISILLGFPFGLCDVSICFLPSSHSYDVTLSKICNIFLKCSAKSPKRHKTRKIQGKLLVTCRNSKKVACCSGECRVLVPRATIARSRSGIRTLPSPGIRPAPVHVYLFDQSYIIYRRFLAFA